MQPMSDFTKSVIFAMNIKRGHDGRKSFEIAKTFNHGA